MSLFVNTNISSMNAQRQIFNSQNELSTAFERLSSGFRINSAADDAAGLQISDRMTSQIQGLNQSVRNANDGISLVQTAEGALAEVTTNLQRLRQLSAQAQNGINSDSDKQALQQEVTELLAEINRISSDTQFAGKTLLDGMFSSTFQVGANAGQKIDVGLTQFSGAGFGTDGLGITGLDVTTDSGGSSIARSDITFTQSPSTLAFNEYFAFEFPLTTTSAQLLISSDGGDTFSVVNVSFNASIGDAVNNTTDALNAALGSNLFSPGAAEVVFDNGSSADNIQVVINTDETEINSTFPFTSSFGTVTSSGFEEPDAGPLDTIDGALSRVGSVRAELGATQNRFQSTIRNLSNIAENLASSRSRIRDTDFAEETASLSSNQIIQQASTSLLAQANQRPQAVLSLLG